MEKKKIKNKHNTHTKKQLFQVKLIKYINKLLMKSIGINTIFNFMTRKL